MTQAFLLPSGLTVATAPKPGKRIGKFDFKLLHSDTAQDLSECKHYDPELKACKYQEEWATTYGEGIRIMVCEGDKCEYFTPKTGKK